MSQFSFFFITVGLFHAAVIMATTALLPSIEWQDHFVYFRIPLYHPVPDDATRHADVVTDSNEGKNVESPPLYSKYGEV